MPVLLTGQELSGLDGPEILVVETDAVVALDVAQELRSFGCRVLGPAGTVNDGVALITRHRPDLALLADDVGGPGASDLARLLRDLGVPFAVMTDRGWRDPPPKAAAQENRPGSTPVSQPALASEAAAELRDPPLLLKPFARQQLQRVVGRLLGATSA